MAYGAQVQRRPAVLAAAVTGLILAAALAGCSGSTGSVGTRSPSPATSAAASLAAGPPSSSAPSPVLPPEVVAIRWAATAFADQARLEWSLPPGTDTVDSFRIRYLVNGRQRIADTEHFFLVLTGLRPGDEVRAFVLARGETANSAEVESPPWRQP